MREPEVRSQKAEVSSADAARARLADAERDVLTALAAARSEITRLEDELRAAKLEQLKRDDDFLTEEEFAAILRVSKKTIAEARKAGILKPIYVTDDVWRYSRAQHVAKACEIFPDRKAGAGSPESGAGRNHAARTEDLGLRA